MKLISNRKIKLKLNKNKINHLKYVDTIFTFTQGTLNQAFSSSPGDINTSQRAAFVVLKASGSWERSLEPSVPISQKNSQYILKNNN